MTIKDPDERSFYAIETVENRWSVRELNRQFDSGLYMRLALSKDKEEVHKLALHGQEIQQVEDIFKEPYVLEFLWLDEHASYSESELEQAIINNLQQFILELGKWFLFVGRQQRISNGSDHYFIDLVFYHRFLQCFVLIDLKIGKLSHADMGQMTLYVNRYDKNIRQEWENQTIWLILCKEKNDFVLEYALPNDSTIFAKEYQTYLPNKEQLQQYLQQHLAKTITLE